jgi:hypothetical protein
MDASALPPAEVNSNRSSAFWRYGFWFVVVFTVVFILGDHFFHVRTGILTYNWEPKFDGQSVGSVIFWLTLAVSGWPGFWLLARFWDGDDPPSWTYVALCLAISTVTYWASGAYGYSHYWAFFWVVTAVLVARVLVEGRGHHVAMLVACFYLLGGAVIEAVFIKLGMHDYARPDVLGMPAWIFVFFPFGAFLGVAWARKARAAN